MGVPDGWTSSILLNIHLHLLASDTLRSMFISMYENLTCSAHCQMWRRQGESSRQGAFQEEHPEEEKTYKRGLGLDQNEL